MASDKKKDQLYSQPLPEVGAFIFDDRVAQVFPDMINRSVPAYSTIVNMIGLLAHHYAQPDSNCYDLGCSLGATSLAIRDGVRTRNCRVVAVDNSQAMLDQFRSSLGDDTANIELRCEDIRETKYDNASFVALNFTLQFLSPTDRLPLIKKIRQNMRPGGCLVLSEKVSFSPADKNTFHEEMHTAFKLANGYSDLEVSQKRAALENVLIRETIDQHMQRLSDAGFGRSYCWFQCFNFVSMIAFND